MPRTPLRALLALALLGGAAAVHAATPATRGTADYVDRIHGFAIALPPGIVAHRDFAHDYLVTGTWKAFAEPDSQGTPLLALVLPGSNAFAAGELRIGVGDSPRERARCATRPAEAEPGQSDSVPLGKVAFVHFRSADAAMMHVVEAESYRAVRNGRCYAIDLLVGGTNPAAYDPPRRPPFTRDQAFARLHVLLRGFRFLD